MHKYKQRIEELEEEVEALNITVSGLNTSIKEKEQSISTLVGLLGDRRQVKKKVDVKKYACKVCNVYPNGELSLMRHMLTPTKTRSRVIFMKAAKVRLNHAIGGL